MITFTVLTIVIEHLSSIPKCHFSRGATCVAFGVVSAFALAAPIDISFAREARLSIEPSTCSLKMRVAHSMWLHALDMHDPLHGPWAWGVIMLPFALVMQEQAAPIPQKRT